ncbi:unnamed protein product, partial [marine sediment metagenome]
GSGHCKLETIGSQHKNWRKSKIFENFKSL